MRKFIFSLKTLVMSLALVVGGSAWAQITGLPFVADFSSGEIAPFTGGSGAFVATTYEESAKVIAANNGEAYAQFDAPYVISNMDEVTVSFQMLNGWLSNGGGNKFAILNSEGVALAAVVYDNKSCNITEVIIDNSMVDDFKAFNGQSSTGSRGANGYATNSKQQHFKLNTSENKYNPEVTIKINSFGGISVSIVGGNNNNNVTYSRAAQPGTKLDLDKVYITNASDNGDRATGYYGLTITNKSMVRYSNDYSDGVVTWTTATGGRFTPVILEEGGNKYLSVDQGSRHNNGTTITSTETEGKVAAGEDFTMSCRVKLGASNDQTATSFNIYDAANSAAILSLAEVVKNATAWTINNGTQTATVSAGGGKGIDELAWIDVKVTSISGGKTYLTLKDAEGNIIDGFDKKDIPTLSTTGGLGKMNFVTSRNDANFAIDDIIVRDVVASEDIPDTPIYTYTVKFVDQEGAEFKDPSVREAYAEEELAITDEDKATVVIGKAKYTYDSDDAAGKTAASDGSTVVTVNFNKTTVADYTVSFVNGEGIAIKESAVHKNVLVGSTVEATAGELSKILVEGVFYEYASGNTPLVVTEDDAQNVINLVFAPVAGVTGYLFQNYETASSVDGWSSDSSDKGRYAMSVVDGSKIADRAVEEGDPVPFANKSKFAAVNQGSRNNNGAGITLSAYKVDQNDFTFEARMILGHNNGNGGTFTLLNNAGNANILKLAASAADTWVINDDAENLTVILPNTGSFSGTDLNNLNNYSWYNFKVTVYNGVTFLTITDEAGNEILNKQEIPTTATTYGVGDFKFATGRYNANFAIDDVTVRSVVVDEDVPAGAEFVAVKINYVDEAGTPLKESAEVNFQVGKPIVLNEALVADFKVTESGEVWTPESEDAPVTKYIYVSDNSDEVEVALGAEVNIIYRGVGSRRVALRYQIQKADGTIVSKDDAGKNFPFFYDSNKTGDILFEGDVLTYFYPFYFLTDGLLYQTANNIDGSAKGTLEIEAGTSTQTKTPITWTPALEDEVQIDNAIFAQESENIEGMTVVKDGYTQIRMANGAAGSAIGGNVLIANLEPGTYTITSATRSGLTNFLAGDEVVFSVESSGTVVTSTSGEFTVDVATPLYIEEQSANTKYSDYVLVRQLSSIASYPITVADGIENGTVEAPTAAAENATVTLKITPVLGYELESISVRGVTSDLAVIVTDGKFTMPADGVTVNATFKEQKIYIETDLTAQFNSLATTKWELSSGQVGWAAPQVTTNSGLTVAAWERYNGSCDWTGDIMYSSVNGLAPGTYKIELYGAAAFTFGRGFGSTAFTGDFSKDTSDTYSENQSIDENTGVTLYAETSEGKVENEIPIWYATNFNTSGIATATLDNVIVGDEGTIKIGLAKTSTSTNWHVVQLKGVTAKVLATDLLAAAAAPLKLYTEEDLTPEMYATVQVTLETYDRLFSSKEEYIRAIAALNTVAEAAAIDAAIVKNAKTVEGATYNHPVESAFVINGTFDEKGVVAPWKSTTGAQNQSTAENQNGDFTVPYYYENWNGAAFTGKLYQTINNIPNGIYSLKIAAFVNNFAGDNQASQYVYANDFKTYLTTGEPTAYEVKDILVENNTLEVGFEQTEATANWCGIDNVFLFYHGNEPTYPINVAVGIPNGTIIAPAKANAGEEVTIKIAPEKDYELASLAIIGANSGEEIEYDDYTQSFEMPAEGVNIRAAFQEAYVHLSDFAYATDGLVDPDGSVKVTGSYNVETAGSYSELFFGDVAFKYNIKNASEEVVYPTGEEEFAYMQIPGDKYLTDGVVSGYVPGLEVGQDYKMTIYSVEAWDYVKMFSDQDYIIFQQDLLGAEVNFTTAQGYEINISDEIENGTVEASAELAAVGTEVTLTATPDAGFELESFSVTGITSNEAVIVTDGKFTMPADGVTVNATFTQKKIYIETDLTSKFNSLATTKWELSSGQVGWAAPQVTTNSGLTVAAWERYNGSCDWTGDIMYSSVTGLTPGTYKIELYGAAAFTFGRGFGSTAFTGSFTKDTSDTYSENQSIDENTGVTLYAETSEGKVENEIPIWYATNFNTSGIATATLDNVIVGDEGTIKIGLSKTSTSTNWHVVQLKGVTAKILASDALKIAVIAASMVEEDDVPEALYREIQETIATYDKAYDTADEYKAAIAALEAVVVKAEAYAPLAEALGEGEEIKANIAEGNPQIATYDEAIADVKAAYDAVAVADIPAAIAVVQAAITPEFVKAQTAPGSDMTRIVPNAAGNKAVGEDNWKLENALADGEKFQLDDWAGTASGMSVPMIEFWHAQGTSLVSNTIYQTIEGLNPGLYLVTATTAVNNEQSVALNEGSALLFANEGTTDITTGGETTSFQGTTGTFTVEGVVGSDGKLTFGFKAVEPNYNWLAFKDVELTFQNVVYPINYAVGIQNGTVEGPAYAAEGDEVELTVTPAEGYELASIAVTNEAGEEIEVMYDSWDGIATFEMPAEAVFVSATFQEAYVKLSDFAYASDGIIDEDGAVKVTGSFTSETAGSYSELFFGDVNFKFNVVDNETSEVVYPTNEEDAVMSIPEGMTLADGVVEAYVPGLELGKSYTMNVFSVSAMDYMTFTEVFHQDLLGATTTFTVINQPVIEPLLVDINVDRYVGYGYAPTVAEVDFTDALEFLGVDEITTDMLSFVNPDLTTISYADYMAANYDGWCDETGKATNWGSTTKICVKFFQAVEDGKYEICDMNGADEVGATYTVRWVANVDTKVVVFTTNVTFVEEPTPAPEIATEVDVPVVITAGVAYEGATATFDPDEVATALGLTSIADAAQYIVNVTTNEFVPNSTDGWRDANGDAATWGTGDGMVCVKIQQPSSGIIDYIGAIDDTYEDGDTYTAKWGFVNTASNTAVVLNINITFSDDPTGFAELKAADGVKPNGKYLEKGKIVIWQNGTKFSTSGTIAR